VRPVGIGLIPIIEEGKCFGWRNGVCFSGGWGDLVSFGSLEVGVCIGLVEL